MHNIVTKIRKHNTVHIVNGKRSKNPLTFYFIYTYLYSHVV
jgi:hypothetical protein